MLKLIGILSFVLLYLSVAESRVAQSFIGDEIIPQVLQSTKKAGIY